MDEQIKSLIADPQITDDPIDFFEYWRIVDRVKWRIIFLAIVITGIVASYTYTLIPQYQSTVTMMINSEKAKLTSISDIYKIDTTRALYYKTQFEILKSRQLAGKVINRLNLLEKADYNQLTGQAETPDATDSALDLSFQLLNLPQSNNPISDKNKFIMKRAIDIFLSKVSFIPVSQTQLIRITYESSDPALAAEVANAIAAVYIESYLESKLEMTANATTWMNERLTNIKDKLDLAEINLQDFLKREKLLDVQGISSLTSKELTDLNKQHSLARQRVSLTKNIYDMSRVKDVQLDDLASIPGILNHPVIQKVRESEIDAEQKISELSKRYGPKHPKMIQAQAELVSVHESFNTQVQKLVASIATEYQTARTAERQLARQVDKTKTEYQRLSVIELQYKSLQQEVMVNRQLYNTFFTRLKETSETSSFQAANARVIDRAEISRWPVKPKKKQIVALAFVGSIVFGILLAFLQDFLSAGIRSVDDIERRLRQRMLGLIPLQKLKRGQSVSKDIFFDKDNPGFAEAIRTIRTSLLMSQMDGDQKIIAVTSSIPGEGKSTLSMNLAFALGQMERVLLIDADLRRPSLGRNFGYPMYQAGLSNLISNSASLSACIVTDQRSNIDLMPAGAIPPNPQELLSSDLVKTALKLLAVKYDRIIIDTAPTQAVSDPLILSTYADSMIYVIKSNSTHIKTAKAGIGRLLQIGANVAGVVLNQVNLEESAKYGDYTGYYDHYGYHADELEHGDMMQPTESNGSDNLAEDKQETGKESDSKKSNTKKSNSKRTNKRKPTVKKKTPVNKGENNSFIDEDDQLVAPPDVQ